ncbi:MAG: putative ABC transporter ATP-binding protein [Methanocella sp. PtaU1.Bin125]|nr:MAG: putative ABC transporter ATP-binding protein [Methanocella sp. PtaU1.Bin125]
MADRELAISVRDLGKRYRIGGSQAYYKTFREAVTNVGTSVVRRLNAGGQAPVADYIWALKGVSFDVERGDVLGVIGRNGAGKSTLLKILSRITEPTEGRAEIYGRVGSLLEVGTGFHPELSGLENIYLSGAILGMRKAEIEAKMDDIVRFSEADRFLETPLKHYSSGMQMRLAFSVAAHLDPEILLIDEVLAVGDIAFQQKCLGKMGQISKEGRTILFISHNMDAVLSLCNKGLLIENGRAKSIGGIRDIVNEYLKVNTGLLGEVRLADEPQKGYDDLKFRAIRIRDARGKVTPIIDMNEDYVVEIEYEITKPVRSAQVAFELFNSVGVCVFCSTDMDNEPENLRSIKQPGTYRARCSLSSSYLRPGAYTIDLSSSIPGVKMLNLFHNAISFEVTGLNIENKLSQGRRGIITPIFRWETQKI